MPSEFLAVMMLKPLLLGSVPITVINFVKNCSPGRYIQHCFFYLFCLCTTRASPVGIPRDIYRYYFFYPSECTIVYLTVGLEKLHLGSEDGYSWSLFDCSCSMWWMLLISLHTSAVFMWYCIIWGRGIFRNAAGLSLVNRLQSVRRCWAICSAFSGQLHSGEDAFFLL